MYGALTLDYFMKDLEWSNELNISPSGRLSLRSVESHSEAVISLSSVFSSSASTGEGTSWASCGIERLGLLPSLAYLPQKVHTEKRLAAKAKALIQCRNFEIFIDTQRTESCQKKTRAEKSFARGKSNRKRRKFFFLE